VLKVVTRPDGFGGIKGRIDLTSTDDINAACLPGCDDQFNYQFNNGTGVRCWVAGWGKDGKGGKFQVIQNKVDVPLMRSSECQRKMKTALGRDAGRDFQLSESEVCAGGEQGKDACDGDGGAPLVCQSKDNRWNVVGLVTWGVDCARKGVPGIYANVYNMLGFILSA
jgi:secreted trypsin-like serine protease